MIAVFTLVAIVQAASIILTLTNAHVFRRQREKQYAFLRTLGNDSALGTPGRLLLPMYLLATVCMSLVTLYLFAFQPHLL